MMILFYGCRGRCQRVRSRGPEVQSVQGHLDQFVSPCQGHNNHSHLHSDLWFSGGQGGGAGRRPSFPGCSWCGCGISASSEERVEMSAKLNK